MFALTFSDESGKTHLIFQNERALLFKSKKEAEDYERDIFVPYLETSIEKGVLVKKRPILGDVYKPLSQEEIRKMYQIGSTIRVLEVKDLKYKK
ncbi:hypothetical protein [Aeromonas phage AS-yj]|uniref:Uncharacterized protein n=4 Tax=Caudoviricetes TaxID=2731619 RepID=A0A291LDQ8_9CAUD|nr:hypothetical protein [Aeromonas phage AS-szw]ATI17980.1 hypothetical protein [Aeromonas phage AS-yj]QAX97970.1 hypothetical protein ASswx1_328 [Aeromonas phage Asswx_1]QAX98986.1 hypothetical protein assk_195 [Aeromonas phage Assk]QMV28977.1 hypothetical protein AP1_0270 [Aeromonas phage AP1]UKM62595.1 hypothetical protein P19_0107 [Aeromonas phage P19]